MVRLLCRYFRIGALFINCHCAPTHNRVSAETGLQPFAEMVFVTAAVEASAAPIGSGGPAGHLADTHNVMLQTAKQYSVMSTVSEG
jgi:hypothetical protein